MKVNNKLEIKDTIKIVTRFAPSPTGVLHVGSVRTALFNYLFARKYGGKFILRIEDTDKERSKKEYEDNILDGLKWLGISYDEIYHQSERVNIHKKYLQRMLDEGNVYEAEENKNGTGKIVRFKNPNTKVNFHDIVRGDIEFDTTDLGDFVIAKDINTPLFHLAVVVDDFEMEVTHIIRGEDHISNTPRQLLIQRAIGAPEPKYAHIPLILASDKSKLSKRHGAVSVTEFRGKGYLPKAVVNFLALIGWNPGDERELFTMEELIKEFSLEKIQKGGAIFNVEKLDWINKEYIKKMNSDEIMKILEASMPESVRSIKGISCDKFEKILPIVIERINVFSDIEKMAKEGELQYFFSQPKIDIEKLFWKDEKDVDKTKERIEKVVSILQKIPIKDFTAEKIKESIWDYATKEGRGSVLWPIRYALSGREKSPDPFTLIEIFGKEETISRLQTVIQKLN
jgi:glutamyl-tRNA synthetase